MCRLVRTAEQHIDTLAASGLLPASEADGEEAAEGRSSGGGGSGGGAAARGRAGAGVFK